MCRTTNLNLVLDLGHHPHSDSFPTSAQLREPEVFYPLRLVSCGACGLLQIDYFVDPKILYQEDYFYLSSVTATGRKHYATLASDICDRFSVPKDSLAVDIGSNVGVLLGGFRNCGMRVLGVDPARITEQAINNGIETIVDFFSSVVADRIKVKNGSASVITATNVFGHLQEIDDVVVGIKNLIAKDGIIVIEAPYALRLVERVEYDTIYHQHISYLSVRPMRKYFERMGLELFDVEEVPIHGGSLRYFVSHPGQRSISPSVAEMVLQEEREGLYDLQELERFAQRVGTQKRLLNELLLRIKTEGKRIVAISTPAKGNTLLNFCHLDQNMIDYATEKNALKIGRHTPGTHIPIYPDTRVLAEMPDYALLLAWNFAEEIMNNMDEYRKRGGKFIIPIPIPAIL